MAADELNLPEVDSEALARAEAALAALTDSYLAWADADAARLAACLEEALRDPQGAALYLPSLFRVAHDIKGQAATFGYPLATDIAHRLCALLTRCPDPGPADLDRIATLVAALVQVIAHRISTPDSDAGRAVLAQLGD